MLGRMAITRDEDVAKAVILAQSLARRHSLSEDSIQRLGTAVSELARNICKYSESSGGDLVIHLEKDEAGKSQLVFQARDNGPGIFDLDKALQDHYSSSGTLGLGLPGVSRMVDSFSIISELGKGTVVTIGMDLP